MKFFLIAKILFLALPIFAKNVEGNELQQMMQVIGIPKNETHTGNDWGQLAKIYPKIKWKNVEDKEYSDARNGSTTQRKTKFDITAKGARSMMFEIESTTFGQGDSYAFRDQIEALGAQVKTICLDEGNAETIGFAWYQISSKEFNPIYAHIEWTGGSGGSGETIKLSLQPIKNTCKTKNYLETKNNSVQSSIATSKDRKFGYLVGTLKIKESGGGCAYYLASDYKQVNKKSIGKTVSGISGIVLNIDGKDILIKGRNDSKGEFLGSFGTSTLRIPVGKIKVDSQDGSEEQRTQFNLNSSGTVTQTSVVGDCHE